MNFKYWKEILLVLIIFLLGFLLRAQESISHNFLFLLDQGRDMMAVKSILYDHHLTLIGPYTSLQGVFQGPFWYYLLAIPTLLTGGDPWGGVILMLLISLTTMATTYFCIRRLFGAGSAVVCLFFLAIAPEAIAAATFAWNPHPMWLLLCVYIFSLFELRNGNQKMHFVVWPIITLMFHFETALAVFILAATLLDLALFDRKTFRNKLFLYGFVSSFVFFLPQVLFDLKHNFLMFHSVLNVFKGHNQGLMVKNEHTIPFEKIVANHFDFYSTNFAGGFFHEKPLDLIQNFYFAGAFAGAILTTIQNKSKENSFLIMLYQLVALIFILTLFYPFPLRPWFLTGFQLFFILIVGLSFAKLLKVKLGIIALSILFVINIFYITPKLIKLYSKPDYGGVAKMKGKEDAIKSIYLDAKGKPFNLLVFTPPVNTDAYDYLAFWLAKSKYHYTPGNKKSGTFYLLIEPDPSQFWSYQGWLETVIKTGKVIETTTLPSGLIVQKRISE